MNWKCAWKELPKNDGVYLCDMEDHYALCDFKDGKFQPNDWGMFSGSNFTSMYSGCEECISHWMELPVFRKITESDRKEISIIKKEKKKQERKAKNLRGY